jgi:hypothetical protein
MVESTADPRERSIASPWDGQQQLGRAPVASKSEARDLVITLRARGIVHTGTDLEVELIATKEVSVQHAGDITIRASVASDASAPGKHYGPEYPTLAAR